MMAEVYKILTSRASDSKEESKGAQHCCVPGCTSDSRYSPETPVWFHAFPKDKGLRKAWIVKIRRDEGPFFQVTKSTVVCSLHFTPADYKWTPVKKLLIKGAIPSKFPWSKQRTSRQGRATGRTDGATPGHNVPVGETESDENEKEEQMEVDPPESSSPVSNSHEQNLREELRATQLENERLKLENLELQQKINISKFGIERFSTDDSKIRFYTGFTSYLMFIVFFNWIQPSASSMRSMYYQASESVSLAGRKRSMLLIDEFFMFMCRLRLGLLEEDLADRFNCTVQTISRKVLTWVNYMYFVLGSIPIWLQKSEIIRLMPASFKTKYASTRVVVDCTEIVCQVPSSMVLNNQTFSHNKSRTTLKSFIGVAPHGAMTFLSPLYSGCISDIEIVKLSGIRDLLEEGDSVMADKGFRLEKYFAEKNIGLNMPPFLCSNTQFTPEQVAVNEEIASLRVHVERFNRRVKENHIFDTAIPMSMIGSINQFWSVACILANFQGPLIMENDTD